MVPEPKTHREPFQAIPLPTPPSKGLLIASVHVIPSGLVVIETVKLGLKFILNSSTLKIYIYSVYKLTSKNID